MEEAAAVIKVVVGGDAPDKLVAILRGDTRNAGHVPARVDDVAFARRFTANQIDQVFHLGGCTKGKGLRQVIAADVLIAGNISTRKQRFEPEASFARWRLGRRGW